MQLGSRAQALSILLNKHYGVPLRGACKILQQGFGLSLTRGGLSQLIQRAGKELQPHHDHLVEQIRHCDAVYGDEASRYVGGPGHWLWVFNTPHSTVYRIAPSRGHPVAAKVLGCLWKDVRDLTRRGDTLAAEEFAARRLQLTATVDELLAREVTQLGDRKFRTRMANARPHLLGCLDRPVDPTNNRAERAIRPAVVARKISCGNKTDRGARAAEILMSLITTAHQRARDFLADLAASVSPQALPAG